MLPPPRALTLAYYLRWLYLLRQAGGYHRSGYQLWTYRYREQAFDAGALLQGMAAL